MRDQRVFQTTFDGTDNLTIGRVSNGWIVRRTTFGPGLLDSSASETRVAETPEKLAELVEGWARGQLPREGDQEAAAVETDVKALERTA